MWGRLGWVTPDYVPDSKQVLSDAEFDNKWDDILARTPRYSGTDAFTDPGARSMAQNEMWNAFNRNFGSDGTDPALQQLFATASRLGVAVNGPGGDGTNLGFNPYTDAGAPYAQQMGAIHQTEAQLSPEYIALSKQRDTERKARTDAYTRETGAYNQMQGGGYFGGFMDDRYSQPYSGQMQQGGQANGDPTSWGSGAAAAPGSSGFGDTFGAKPRQYRAGSWGGYGW